MRNILIGITIAGMLLVGGCSKGSSSGDSGPTATVNLKDGTSFTGSVTKSDTSGITVVGGNGETRTYPMTQVDSVKYVDTAMGNPGSVATSSTPAAPPPPVMVTIPAGATISVRTSNSIKAGTAGVGQTFPGMVTADVLGNDGGVAIPRGSDAMLIVRASEAQGKIQGQSEIALDLDSVSVGGRRYSLETIDIVEKGKQGLGKNKRSAKFVGGGAILGTVIGAIAGGPKGAAIGAGAGAGAGVAAQSLTRGKSVSIPAESVLHFKLEEPVEIRAE